MEGRNAWIIQIRKQNGFKKGKQKEIFRVQMPKSNPSGPTMNHSNGP